MRRSTCFEYPFEFIKLDNADQWFANLRHFNSLRGSNFHISFNCQPTAERAHRSGIAVNRPSRKHASFRARLAPKSTQPRKKMDTFYLVNVHYFLLFKKSG